MNLLRAWLLGVGSALALGLALGYSMPERFWLRTSPETDARTRVGYALRASPQSLPTGAWAELAKDVGVVRSTVRPEDRALFELVLAAHGLETEGRPEWPRAERFCNDLKFPRCDKQALLRLREPSALAKVNP